MTDVKKAYKFRHWPVFVSAGLIGVVLLVTAWGDPNQPAPSGAKSPSEGSFRFTVTGDVRQYDALFGEVLGAVRKQFGSVGVFGVSVGDDDPPEKVRARIDARIGPGAMWYHGTGNHEAGKAACMRWLRKEYTTGQDGRPAIRAHTNQDGPAGCAETTYSWNYGNAHFVMLNEYWDGSIGPGSDSQKSGDVVPALLEWLARDLEKNTLPVVFVFGHEPAYPQGPRHTGDSLNANAKHRDAFWELLEKKGVQAYFCGHTHYFSRYRSEGGRVWQVDVGNSGNQPKGLLVPEGLTFMNVLVTPTEVRYEVWRDSGTKTFSLAQTWTEPVH